MIPFIYSLQDVSLPTDVNTIEHREEFIRICLELKLKGVTLIENETHDRDKNSYAEIKQDAIIYLKSPKYKYFVKITIYKNIVCIYTFKCSL